MTKKKETTKAEAAKVETKEKKATPSKVETLKITDVSEKDEIKPVEGLSSQSDTITQEDKEITHTVTKNDLENNPESGLKEGDVVTLHPDEESETAQKEFEADNKKQFNALNKLKAVAYNEYTGTRFKKLDKRISLKNLKDRSKLPAQVNINSEILMSNGQIYTLKDGLTAKFEKESLQSL